MAKYFKVNAFDVEKMGRRPSTSELMGYMESKKISLQTGDVINLGQDRQKYAYVFTSNGGFIKNPDESGSGYLTVPLSITKSMKDAVGHYSGVIRKLGVEFGDIELGMNDAFIQKILKRPSELLAKATFSYAPYDNRLYVGLGRKSNVFDVRGLKQDDIEAFFAEQPQAAKKKPGLISRLKNVFTKKRR